jgi:hypothetical protein
MRTRIGWLLAAVLMVTACSGETVTTGTTSAPAATLPIVTSTTETVTSTTGATTTTSVATTTAAASVDVTTSAGEVAGPERFSFAVGDEVSIWVLADTSDEIHVHGYDVYFEVQPGNPVEVAFTADVPGIFEVELESSHVPLFELEVTP